MKQNLNIEAEGSELILKNKEGDYVIIPKKYRTEVQGMIKDSCHSCIDTLVETLPVMADYAQDGNLLPSWDKIKATLNPYNWGVTDYSDKGDFNTAYAAARKAGEKEFMWNNKRFSADNPKSNILNKVIANNIYPYGGWTVHKPKFKIDYDELMKLKYYNEGVYTTDKKLTRDDIRKITRNEKGESIYDLYTVKGKSFPGGGRGPKDLNASYDALSLFNNQPQKYNSFVESKYKPSDSKNTDAKYYSFNHKYEKQIENDLLLYDNRDFINSEENKKQVTGSAIAGASLKDYQYSKGQDSKGKYIAYYDINDYGNILDIVPNTNPFEIYGRIYYKDYSGQNKRMYYSDKELSELDVDKKDFDTLALQRELSNRGYKLPKSTKQDGTFDGIWGDETKNALLDYQTKNKAGDNPEYTDDAMLNIKAGSGDYDVKEVQRELSNRGYKLPKSTKQDGTFDGIWGDETKNALLDYQNSYKRFKNSLPDNLKNTNEKDYDLRYLWKHSGKPKDMYDAQGWDRNKSFEENYNQDIELLKTGKYDYNKGIFRLVEDKEQDGTVSYNYHGNTIEPNTMRFLKSKNHSTINMELDWYNSDNPDAVDFRSKYDLDTSGKFYRYVPKTKKK